MTEKDYNPKQKERKAMEQQPKKIDEEKPVEAPVKEDKKIEEKTKTEEKKEEPKKETKKPSKKVKKEEVVVNGRNVHVSTKYAAAICRFIKRKRIGDAIRDLEQVIALKKPIPMKGEIPHRKGKIMSGRFPQRAAKEFIVLLKSLAGNANNHEIDEPVISGAVANLAARPFGRFGRVKRKRTHITIKAREMKVKETKKKIKGVKK